jgi:hypothetical protein
MRSHELQLDALLVAVFPAVDDPPTIAEPHGTVAANVLFVARE